MACPLRIAVVGVSALVALLALYLTFWSSDDELDKDVQDAASDEEEDDEKKVGAAP